MIPIGESNDAQGITHDIVPADLHDYSGAVYNDNLCSFLNISTSVVNNVITVDLMATDLVQHVNARGEKGYWIGIGISSELLDGATVYSCWGSPEGIQGTQPITPEGTKTVDGREYGQFYWDASLASANSNRAFLLVEKGTERLHYNINFSSVHLKEPDEPVQPMSWSQVSVSQVKENYLFGINLADSNGNPLPDGLFAHYVNSAVDYFETLLDITIAETEFSERHDYIRNDYQNWGFIQLDHNPVKEVRSVELMYGDKPSVNIPLDWVQVDKLTGQLTLFPSAGSANSLIIGQTGLLFGFQSQWDWSPMMWKVDYVAGIDDTDPALPLELLKEGVSKRASCGILNVWGRVSDLRYAA